MVETSGQLGASVVLGVGEEHGERGASSAQPRLDGALRDAELGGDVAHGQVGDVVQDEGPALGVGELAQGVDEGDVVGVR